MRSRLPRRVRRLPALMAVAVGTLTVGGGALLSAVNLAVTVRAEGILLPKRYLEVRAEREGIIRRVLVQTNQLVARGELLVVLYDDEERDQLARAEAASKMAQAEVGQAEVETRLAGLLGEGTLRAAQAEVKGAAATWQNVLEGPNPEEVLLAEEKVREAQVKLAEAHRKRDLARELHAEGLIPRQEMEHAQYLAHLAAAGHGTSLQYLEFVKKRHTELQTEALRAKVEEKEAETAKAMAYPLVVAAKEKRVLAARERLQNAQAEVQIWQRRVAWARVRAPAAGKVLTTDLERLVGKHVEPGEVLMVLGETGEMVVRIVVPEAEIPHLRPGLPALVYLAAYPYTEYEVFDGRLAEIAPSLYFGERASRKRPPPFLENVLTAQQNNGTSPAQFFTTATVELSRSSFQREGGVQGLEPGLSASVDIIVRRTTPWRLVEEKVRRGRQFLANLHLRL